MVYFIQGRITGLIKIGLTTSRCLTEATQLRIAELQAASPDELVILAVVPNWYRREEQLIHKKFSHLRVHHEWFKSDKKLLDFINHFIKGEPIKLECTSCGKQIEKLYDKKGHQLFTGSIDEAMHPLCFKEKEYEKELIQ